MAVEVTDELEALRAEAEALGVTVDGRWGEARLREEIAAASSSTGDEVEPEVEPADSDSGDVEESSPESVDEYIRAGGHIDRGDGKGWMLEE